MANQNISVVVVVNTEDVFLDNLNVNAPLRSLAERALATSESRDRQLADFDLKDGDGTVLDLSRKISDAGIREGTKLYLALRAGVTG